MISHYFVAKTTSYEIYMYNVGPTSREKRPVGPTSCSYYRLNTLNFVTALSLKILKLSQEFVHLQILIEQTVFDASYNNIIYAAPFIDALH